MLRPHRVLTIISVMLFAVVGVAAASSVRFEHLSVNGIPVNVVRVDLRDPHVQILPVLAPAAGGRAHPRASLGQFVRTYWPLAAINGTFFDTRNYRITGNVAVGGRLLAEGYIGNAIAFDRQNRPTLICNTHRMGRHTAWGKYACGLGGGPTLLIDGIETVCPRAEGFRDAALFRLAARSALGYTPDQKLLMVNVPVGVSLRTLARVMRGLGAHTAISLDGGCSAAMYYNGRIVHSPQRPLTNMLAVFVRPLAAPVAHWMVGKR
jgi:hypothetical protein